MSEERRFAGHFHLTHENGVSLDPEWRNDLLAADELVALLNRDRLPLVRVRLANLRWEPGLYHAYVNTDDSGKHIDICDCACKGIKVRE